MKPELKRGTLLKLAFAAIALLCVAHSPARANERGMGYLIFTPAQMDPVFGPVHGQARRILDVTKRAGYPTYVDVIVENDDKGDGERIYSVPFHFYTEGGFLTAGGSDAFYNAILSGASYDLSECMHPKVGRPERVEPLRDGCTDEVYEAQFHCDLPDSPKWVDSYNLKPDRYLQLNPNEATIYIHQRKCEQ